MAKKTTTPTEPDAVSAPAADDAAPPPAATPPAPAPDALTSAFDAAEARIAAPQAALAIDDGGAAGAGRPRKWASEAERRAYYNSPEYRKARKERLRGEHAVRASAQADASRAIRETREVLATRAAQLHAENLELQNKLAATNERRRAELGGSVQKMLSKLVEIGFGLIGRARTVRDKNTGAVTLDGSFWQVHPVEADELADAVYMVAIDHWAAIEKYLPWLAVVFTAWGIVEIRLQVEAGTLTPTAAREQVLDKVRAKKEMLDLFRDQPPASSAPAATSVPS